MSGLFQFKGTKMLTSLGFVFAAVSLAGCIPVQQVSTRSKVLLVSFDGFRWNYDQDVDTPNLDAMAAEGVKARYMTPAFITITSPCHFTLLTGECPPAASRAEQRGAQAGEGQSQGLRTSEGNEVERPSGLSSTQSFRIAAFWKYSQKVVELSLHLPKANSTRCRRNNAAAP